MNIDAIAKAAFIAFVIAVIFMVAWIASHHGEMERKCEDKGGVLVRNGDVLPVCIDANKITLD